MLSNSLSDIFSCMTHVNNNKVYLFPFGFYNEMHLIIRLKPDSAYMLDM